MVHFGEFLKTWSLRSNSVTRQVRFNRTKIGGKCQNSNATFWVIFKQCVVDGSCSVFERDIIVFSTEGATISLERPVECHRDREIKWGHPFFLMWWWGRRPSEKHWLVFRICSMNLLLLLLWRTIDTKCPTWIDFIYSLSFNFGATQFEVHRPAAAVVTQRRRW